MLVPNHIVWNNNTNLGMSENNTVCSDFTPKKRVTSTTSNEPQYFTQCMCQCGGNRSSLKLKCLKTLLFVFGWEANGLW